MENDANGASASGKRLGAAALGLLHSHIELLGIELQEQKGRTLRLLLFAGLALVFALLLLTAFPGCYWCSCGTAIAWPASSACACSMALPRCTAGCA